MFLRNKSFCPFAEVNSAYQSSCDYQKSISSSQKHKNHSEDLISTLLKMLRLRKNKILPQQVSDLGAFIFVVTMIPITYIWEVMMEWSKHEC